MNFAKRAVLSIVRRPAKSLILFLVVLLIGSLMAGTVAVRQAIAQSEVTAKSLLGASVSLGVDDQALMRAYDAGEDPEVGSLTAEIIEQLGTRPEVKSYDYTLSAFLSSKTLKNFEPDADDSGGAVAITRGGEEGSAYFNLRGTHYAPILPIQEGKLSLVEGRVFTEDEIASGSLVAVIPDVVAEANGLHVGDTITLSNEVFDYTLESSGGTNDGDEESQTAFASRDVILEVIGVFSLNSGGDSALSSENATEDGEPSQRSQLKEIAASEFYSTIYVPIKVAQAEDEFTTEGYRKIAENAGDEWPQDAYVPYYSPLYLLNSVDDLESFEQAARETLPPYYTVISAQSQYQQVAAPMEDIQRLMTAALVAAIVAGLIIVSLVVVLFLRDRRREFGIYLSLGTRRGAIVGQVLIEVLVVAAIALALALFAGSLISGAVSQQMISEQLLAGDQSGSGPYGVISYSSYLGGDASLLMGDLSAEDLVAGYQVRLDAPYILGFLGLGLGTIVLSCVAPLLYVLRLRPRRVLM
ncbi:MAG: ABC transporter permease [Coriobacteriales bacterium]|jgi:putative ABC transport system permease protein|nr:ABC transporter permease [Coriobacteriales bacterium]